MNTLLGPRLLFLLAVAAPVILAFQPANVDAQAQSARPSKGPTARITEKEKMNAWTVGLAGGLLEGAPIRLAAEIARVVDDGPNMHILPIVTRGATENLNSLLYLRGVDMAIINSDALECEIEPLSARRPLRRLPVFQDRQAAGAGLRSEMEVDQSGCDRPRTRSLLGGAGMAGS